MIECSVDGEWRSDVDIKRCGAYRYFESPHCLPLILCWSIDRALVRTWTILEGRECPPDLALHIRSGQPIRAFNAAFERLGFRWLAAHWGWPEPRLEQYRCTAVEGAAMSLPRRLDKIGEALGVTAKKDKRGDKLIKLFSIPRRDHEPASNQSRAVNCTTRESIRPDDGALPESQGPRVPLWNEPRDHPAEFAEFVEYCRQDVRAEQEVASRLIPLSAAEWAVYAMNERVNDRGLRIDVRSARAAINLVARAKQEIDREIAEVTSGAVTAVTQVARLKTWIAAQGLVLPSLDKETIDEHLHSDDSLPGDTRRALELRTEGAKPSTDKISAMVDRTGHDGRARGVYLHHGAGQTGRFSSRGIQAHNLPKYRKCFEDAHLDLDVLFRAIGTEDPTTLGLLFGPELGRPLHLISDAVRSFIWAAPGKEFLVADYSSIEGVMAAWSTGEEWELEAYRKAFAGTGPGVYEINAATMFGVPVEQVTKMQRRGGKVQVLSCQYATGPNGILKFARHEGIKMAPLFDGLWNAAGEKRRAAAERRRASRAKRGDPVLAAHGREAWLAAELTKISYRAQHPRVEAAWGSLEDGAIAAIRSPGTVVRPDGVTGVGLTVKHGFLWLQLPSGRCLAYGRPRLHAQVYARIPLEDSSWSDSERMDWPDALAREKAGLCRIEGECKPKIIVSGTDSQSETWKRFPVYGGSFFNNYIQGMARDVLVHGMQRAEAAGLEVNLHTHDELAAEVWRGSADPAWFERLICDLPFWCAGLPLNAKAFVSKRYRKD